MLSLGLLPAACGVAREPGFNEGFAVAPLEEIDPIAFSDFPDAELVDKRDFLEDSYRTIDGAAVCGSTRTQRTLELSEPVLFSELQTWYNTQAETAGWEITNARDGGQDTRLPDYQVTKQFEGRGHRFSIAPLQPDGTGAMTLREDALVDGYRLWYGSLPTRTIPTASSVSGQTSNASIGETRLGRYPPSDGQHGGRCAFL